jgi:hypothetical protein
MKADSEAEVETWFVNNIALLRNTAGAAPPAAVEAQRYALKWLERAHEKFNESRKELKSPPPAPVAVVARPSPPRRKTKTTR